MLWPPAVRTATAIDGMATGIYHVKHIKPLYYIFQYVFTQVIAFHVIHLVDKILHGKCLYCSGAK